MREPASPPPGPDPTRRSERSRRAILQAALDLVGERGYDRTTIESIAARAGVGKQTIYRWWPSKGALLLDAFVEPRIADGTLDETNTELLLDSGDLEADVRRLLRSTVAEFATPAFESPYRAVLAATQHDPELAAQVRDRVMRPGFDVITAWLDAAQQQGRLRADLDVDVALELLVGPLFHRWLLRNGPLDEAYADRLADAVLVVLTPPAT